MNLLAYLFLKGGDANKSGALLNELSNDYAKGHDNYPKDVASARSLMINHKTKKDKTVKSNNSSSKDNNSNGNSTRDAEQQVGFAQSIEERKEELQTWKMQTVWPLAQGP